MFGRRRRPRPPRAPEPPPAPVAQDIPIEEMFVGGYPSPFTVDEQARIKRNEAAAALLDEDTMGYVVIRLKKNGGDKPTGEVCISGHVLPVWRNHFRAIMDQIARHGLPTVQ
jgi:hypothetical protein